MTTFLPMDLALVGYMAAGNTRGRFLARRVFRLDPAARLQRCAVAELAGRGKPGVPKNRRTATRIAAGAVGALEPPAKPA